MTDAKNEAAGGASASNAGLCLDAEAVQCYLYALLAEAKRRGGMFPQTSDDQDADADAVQMQIYGAKQMLVNCAGRFNSDVCRVLDDLGNIAFENGLECIREGKYEGAPA